MKEYAKGYGLGLYPDEYTKAVFESSFEKEAPNPVEIAIWRGSRNRSAEIILFARYGKAWHYAPSDAVRNHLHLVLDDGWKSTAELVWEKEPLNDLKADSYIMSFSITKESSLFNTLNIYLKEKEEQPTLPVFNIVKLGMSSDGIFRPMREQISGVYHHFEGISTQCSKVLHNLAWLLAFRCITIYECSDGLLKRI